MLRSMDTEDKLKAILAGQVVPPDPAEVERAKRRERERQRYQQKLKDPNHDRRDQRPDPTAA